MSERDSFGSNIQRVFHDRFRFLMPNYFAQLPVADPFLEKLDYGDLGKKSEISDGDHATKIPSHFTTFSSK